MLLAFSLYLIAHFIRALRYFFLVVDKQKSILGAFRVHFFSSCIAIFLPFRLGDLFRMSETGFHLKDYKKAFIVVLVERWLDAFILGTIWLLLPQMGFHQPRNLIISIIFFFIISAVLIYFGFGNILKYLKEIILKEGSSARSIWLLYNIETLENLNKQMKKLIHGHWFIYILFTCFIWLAEVSTIILLLPENSREDLQIFQIFNYIFTDSPITHFFERDSSDTYYYIVIQVLLPLGLLSAIWQLSLRMKSFVKWLDNLRLKAQIRKFG